MRRALLLAVVVAIAGCASEPEKAPTESEALDRALAVVREAFAKRVRGDGAERPDREVVRASPESIVYRSATPSSPGRSPGAEGVERTCTLAFADVESLEGQVQQEKPARPENVYLYLTRGSGSAASSDAIVPPLAAEGVVRAYVELRDRPAGTRGRLARALDVLARARARRAPAPVAPVASPTTPVTKISSEELERELRALERMKKDGLIDEATYERKRKELLARY